MPSALATRFSFNAPRGKTLRGRPHGWLDWGGAWSIISADRAITSTENSRCLQLLLERVREGAVDQCFLTQVGQMR